MNYKIIFIFSLLIITCGCSNSNSDNTIQTEKNNVSHTFSMDSTNFILDDVPIQIISGELHYARIPKEYWRHRIQMAKAMGCNSIATYVFWNYHEQKENIFDFTTENRDLKRFIEIAQEEEMWVLLRPGPYVCAEWDLGGIPPYLLSIPDIKLRCMDNYYMKAVERYINKLSSIVKPLLITNGGPIILLQVENEYGSYANDRVYMKSLKELWVKNGINIPFYTSDGATPYMLEAGSLPNCAVGLDPCWSSKAYNLAKEMNPGVPVFSSETYPGWLTHWGEKWAKPDTSELYKEVNFLMENKISVNFFMLHGGTNFGFTAGANSGGHGYEPDVTSYDYDAPINENGDATHKYYAIKKILSRYNHTKEKTIEQPAPIPVMEIPEIQMKEYSSVWNSLPKPIASIQPKPFEYYKHYQGFALYKTTLIGHKKGKLQIHDIHDYATVFVDGRYIGSIDRRLGQNSLELPESDSVKPILEIFVEGMGRINFAQELIDRKGITDRVTLNRMTLMNWEVYCLPMESEYINNLKISEIEKNKPGKFFKGSFNLSETADTYIDLSTYTKGVVWLNGNNLGRYWEIGPQHSLYCPKSMLKMGKNEIVIFDLHQLEAKPVKGIKYLY